MAIINSNQNWTLGSTVKVGFLSLTVVRFIPTPEDGRPDVYVLESKKGKLYQFTPHYGLEALD